MLKVFPVLTSRFDLWHSFTNLSQLTELSSMFSIILSIVESTIHDSSLISTTTELECLLLLNTEAWSSGEELIIRVAPVCTCSAHEKFWRIKKIILKLYVFIWKKKIVLKASQTYRHGVHDQIHCKCTES